MVPISMDLMYAKVPTSVLEIHNTIAQVGSVSVAGSPDLQILQAEIDLQ